MIETIREITCETNEFDKLCMSKVVEIFLSHKKSTN